MLEGTAGYTLLGTAIVFVAFVLIKARLSFTRRDPEQTEGRARLAEARVRAKKAAGNSSERAAAWRDAALIALDELGRPNLAASFARRADRADPSNAESLTLVARAMRRSRRYRALEKILWRHLDGIESGPGYDRAFDELLALYDGPLKRAHQARVLRALRKPTNPKS